MPHCKRDTHGVRAFTTFLWAKQESKISNKLLGPTYGKCGGRRKPLRAARATWCLGKSVFSPHPFPTLVLTLSSSLLISLSASHAPPHPLIPLLSFSFPFPFPSPIGFQYSQEGTEETGYIPSIVGQRSHQSCSKYRANTQKQMARTSHPSLRKQQKQLWLVLKSPTARVTSWTTQWQILPMCQTKALNHLNT